MADADQLQERLARMQKPVAATGRGIGAGIRGALFGIVWLVVRAWRVARLGV